MFRNLLFSAAMAAALVPGIPTRLAAQPPSPAEVGRTNRPRRASRRYQDRPRRSSCHPSHTPHAVDTSSRDARRASLDANAVQRRTCPYRTDAGHCLRRPRRYQRVGILRGCVASAPWSPSLFPCSQSAARSGAPPSIPSLFSSLHWRSIGPAATGGRIDDLAVARVPGQPDAIYVGDGERRAVQEHESGHVVDAGLRSMSTR